LRISIAIVILIHNLCGHKYMSKDMTTVETTKPTRRTVTVERWKRPIQKKIRTGDQEIISEVTGKTQSFISRVLSGERKCEAVWVVAKEIVNNRQELIYKLIDRLKAQQKGKGEE
jgi:hypothetical protein